VKQGGVVVALCGSVWTAAVARSVFDLRPRQGRLGGPLPLVARPSHWVEVEFSALCAPLERSEGCFRSAKPLFCMASQELLKGMPEYPTGCR